MQRKVLQYDLALVGLLEQWSVQEQKDGRLQQAAADAAEVHSRSQSLLSQFVNMRAPLRENIERQLDEVKRHTIDPAGADTAMIAYVDNERAIAACQARLGHKDGAIQTTTAATNFMRQSNLPHMRTKIASQYSALAELHKDDLTKRIADMRQALDIYETSAFSNEDQDLIEYKAKLVWLLLANKQQQEADTLFATMRPIFSRPDFTASGSYQPLVYDHYIKK